VHRCAELRTLAQHRFVGMLRAVSVLQRAVLSCTLCGLIWVYCCLR
jgi:hypothetical protein